MQDKIDWVKSFGGRTGEELLPQHLPTDLLHALARSIAKYKGLILDSDEANDFENGIALWIRRLFDAQWESDDIVGEIPFLDMVEELERFIHKEIVSRQVNFQVYHLSLRQLFVEDKWRLS